MSVLRAAPRDRRGFTLIEVLVSLGLLALLSSAVGVFLIDLRDQGALLRDLADDRRTSETLFGLIDASLTTADGTDRAGEPGFVGEPESLRMTSRRIGLASVDGDAEIAGAQGVEIRFEREAHRLLIGAQDDPEMREILSERVEHLRFRYHDGEQWVDSFTSRGERALPSLVEVSIWFGPVGGELARQEEFSPVSGRPTRAESGEDVDRFSAEDVRGLFEEMEAERVERIVRPPDRMRVFHVPGGEVDPA